MAEEQTSKGTKAKSVGKHVKRAAGGLKKAAGKKSVLQPLVVVLLVALVGYGIFNLGEHRGAKRQEAIDAKKRAATINRPSVANRLPDGQTRKTLYGNVTNISNTSIDVKPKTGNSGTAAIDSKTIITGIDGKKTDVKAIKKDQMVIVSGIADKNGKITAQRIRIQK